MYEREDKEAKKEIGDAYRKAIISGAIRDDSPEGLEFGRVCAKWQDWYNLHKTKDKGDRIRFMWKALGVPHTTAYDWISKYRAKSGVQPPIVQYTQEELARSEQKAEREHQLERRFDGCGFPYYIKQNCAVNEPHYNVIFTALPEERVHQLANTLLRGVHCEPLAVSD